MTLPVTAHASDGALFVDRSSLSCSDTGPGTEAVPFCSVQKAVNTVKAGQTVTVFTGTYPETVTVSNSGTAEAPITIQEKVGSTGSTSVLLHGLAITGASHLTIRGVRTRGSVVVSDSHDLTIERSAFYASASPGPTVQVTGGSSRVSLIRSQITSRSDSSAVVVDKGSSDTVISTDIVDAPAAQAKPLISVSGASGTAVTSNTVRGNCDAAIAVDAAATASSLENNVITVTAPTPPCTAPQTAVRVSTDSAAQTRSAYNLFDAAGTVNLYDWAGTAFTSLDTFRTNTGQGANDLTGQAKTEFDSCHGHNIPVADSAALDSADTSAPGELTADFYGVQSSDDPEVPNTGSGYRDRGAIERGDCIWISFLTGKSRGPRDWSLDVQVGHGWSSPAKVTVDWGDGGSEERPFSSQGIGFVIDHSYARLGKYQVTVTATDGVVSRTSTVTAYTNSNGYTPVTPTRLLDTRKDPDSGGRVQPIPARDHRLVPMPSLIPEDANAVVLNVTAVNPQASGYLTVYRSSYIPPTSSLNFAPGAVVANLVTIEGRDISVYNGSGATTDVVVDVEGYYRLADGDGYTPVSPVRLLDTRATASAPARTVPAHGSLTLPVAGVAGVPAKGADAVALNLTAVNATAEGYITAYPGGTARPTASNLNFAAHRIVPNAVTVPTGTDGTITLYNGSSAPVDLVADLQGYYTRTGGLAFHPAEPSRLLDTRINNCCALSPNYTMSLDVHGLGSSDDAPFWYGAKAVVLNTTVTQPTAPGYLTVFPKESTWPTASNLNFTPDQTVANMTTTKVSADGWVSLHNGSWGYTHVIADLAGYFY